MTSLGAAIRAILRADSQIFIRVGDRIFPNRRPQKTESPAIVYRVISSYSDHSIVNASGLSVGLFEVDVYSSSYDLAVYLADRVRLALDAYRGVASGVCVHGMFRDGRTDEAIEPVNAGDAPAWSVTQEFEIFYAETAPDRVPVEEE